jgi:TonB family protein
MTRRILRLLPLALLAACPHARPLPTPYASDACPLPPDVMGYTVVARAADTSLADQAYLRHVVREVVSRWEPTGKPWRDEHDTAAVEWTPPELFWRREWRPRPDQHADLAITIHGDGRWSTPRLASSGPDSSFVRGVLDAARRTLTAPARADVQHDSARFALPAAALASGADSLVVHLLFGERPKSGERAVAQFAVQERPVAPRSSVAPAYPAELLEIRREGSVTMQFLVDDAGRVNPASMRVLEAGDPAFAREVARVLPRYTFAPAMLDCATVSELVQMPFTFGIQKSGPGSSRARGSDWVLP